MRVVAVLADVVIEHADKQTYPVNYIHDTETCTCYDVENDGKS